MELVQEIRHHGPGPAHPKGPQQQGRSVIPHFSRLEQLEALPQSLSRLSIFFGCLSAQTCSQTFRITKFTTITAGSQTQSRQQWTLSTRTGRRQGQGCMRFPPQFVESVHIQNEQRKVAPVWPSQPWYASLLTLSCKEVHLLPAVPSLLMNQNRATPTSGGDDLQLAACKLTSQVSTVRSFRNRLPSSSQPPDGQLLGALTARAVRNVVAGALDGILILFLQSKLSNVPLPRGLSQTIGCYRSTLSQDLPPLEGSSLGTHPAVSRLMKGIFNTNPQPSQLGEKRLSPCSRT